MTLYKMADSRRSIPPGYYNGPRCSSWYPPNDGRFRRVIFSTLQSGRLWPFNASVTIYRCVIDTIYFSSNIRQAYEPTTPESKDPYTNFKPRLDHIDTSADVSIYKEYPNRWEMLIQSWLYVGPASLMVDQHENDIGQRLLSGGSLISWRILA